MIPARGRCPSAAAFARCWALAQSAGETPSLWRTTRRTVLSARRTADGPASATSGPVTSAPGRRGSSRARGTAQRRRMAAWPFWRTTGRAFHSPKSPSW
eukprot:13324796-Alexandrium_andersonii.AAC.1